MNGLTKWNPITEMEKWNPFQEMEELHNRLTSMLARSPFRWSEGREEAMTLAEWAPVVNIAEDDKQYVIEAELPEIRKEDVNVTVQEGVLTISGERKFQKEEKGRKYHRVERAYGTFERSFTIPDDADAGTVHAEFKDGVLRVHVGKSEKSKSTAIEVKVD
ncbi:MAG: Hsp20/alpha crystallin family protein [Candidatus Omnitrophica bacterium]|nr:Hsp20/alpha crystallin family protein [Candidatus Omnitrophota bacterium]